MNTEKRKLRTFEICKGFPALISDDQADLIKHSANTEELAIEFAEKITEAASCLQFDDDRPYRFCPFCESDHIGSPGFSDYKENHGAECVVLKAQAFLCTDLSVAEDQPTS